MVIVLHALGDYFYKESSFGSSLWWCLGFINEFCRTGVPLFFMISGFLLLKEDIPDIKEFYKRRFTKICIPLACYNVFYYVDNELEQVTVLRILYSKRDENEQLRQLEELNGGGFAAGKHRFILHEDINEYLVK